MKCHHLRTEGSKELMEIHDLFYSKMGDLSRSHKRDLVKLLKAKANVEQQLADEQAQLAEAQQELARIQEELSTRDALIADLHRASPSMTQV